MRFEKQPILNENRHKHTTSVFILTVLLVFISLTAGCASNTSSQLPLVETIPQVPGRKPSLNVSFSYRPYLNKTPVPIFLKTRAKRYRNQLLQNLSDSNLFAKVGENDPTADLDLKVELRDERKSDPLSGMLSGTTYFLVPTYGTENFIVNSTIKIRRTGERRKIQVTDSSTQWMHVFPKPPNPFDATTVALHETVENIYSNLAYELSSQGVIAAAVSPMQPDLMYSSHETVGRHLGQANVLSQ